MPTIEELKYLSQRRLVAAEVLHRNEVHDIAYHDSGYIIEFGLKAAICKRKNFEAYPENSGEYFTHVYDRLVKLASLEEELAKKRATDREFMKNWSIATKWSVHLRYKPIGKDEKTVSKTFLKAVKTEDSGVLPWIKTHW